MWIWSNSCSDYLDLSSFVLDSIDLTDCRTLVLLDSCPIPGGRSGSPAPSGRSGSPGFLSQYLDKRGKQYNITSQTKNIMNRN